jgi:hypothetical protein
MEKIESKEVKDKNVSHVLMSCGWIPVDEGTFDNKEVYSTEDGFFMIDNKRCFAFYSEKKLIICPTDSILAIKFNQNKIK